MPVRMFGLLVVLTAACGGVREPSPEKSGASPTTTSGYESVVLALPVGDAQAGRQAFVDLKCTTCHRITVETGFPVPFSDNLGPDLDARPPHRGASDIATAIVAPSHAVSTKVSSELKMRLEGHLSPMGDFSQAMTVRQLSDLVAYLRSVHAPP